MTVPLASFIAARLHTRVVEPGWLGGQCTDLAAAWARLGWGVIPPHANAADWPRWHRAGLRWTANAPANFPPQGALVVWHAYGLDNIGTDGHIAIALAADSAVIVSVDQNWPPSAPVDIIAHDYGGVAGWLAPVK